MTQEAFASAFNQPAAPDLPGGPGMAPADPASDIEAWIEAHQQLFRTCSRLPGQPRITQETCHRRRALARQIRDRAGNESLFDGGGPVGLESCLSCPEVEDQ